MASFHTVPRFSGLMPRFVSERAGNISMIFGLSMLAMFTTAGGAIDFARWYNAKSKLQGAMDSASLAGGRALQLTATTDYSVAIATATEYFNKMKPVEFGNATPNFAIIESDTVMRGTVNFTVPTPFLALIGIASFRGSVFSETVIAAGGNAGTNLELSLMLDTTGSMTGQKIEDLKVAAKELVDIVVWGDQSQYTSKIAIAPFSSRVNVGSYAAQLTGMTATWNSRLLRPCVTERTGTEAFTDAAPASGAWLNGSGGDRNYDTDNYSSTGSCTQQEEIIPLTSDKEKLKSAIGAFSAGGSTAGSLGTAWAWYLLSPKWASIWTGESTPAPYSDITTLTPKGMPKLHKVAVLMTDGIYNTKGGVSYADGGAEAISISQNAVTICNNMKAAGIKVYTIGFQLGGSTLAINTLKACASRDASDPADNPSYFISAESGDELRMAFRQIALQLSTLRIRS